MTKRAAVGGRRAARKGATKRAGSKSAAKKGTAKQGATTKSAAKRNTATKASPRKSAERKSAPKKSSAKKTPARKGGTSERLTTQGAGNVLAQLGAMGGAGGTLRLPNAATLGVTSLDKVFFPKTGHTKGDIMRWYARVAPMLLPLIADRP